VDTQGDNGWTALMLACMMGQVEAARLLLKMGASRTVRCTHSTALEFIDLGETPDAIKTELRALLHA
jgi:ankyrin repeat protein